MWTLGFPTPPEPGIPSGLTHYNDGADVNYKTGYDADLIGGYDLGMFRVEGRAGLQACFSVKDIEFDQPFLFAVNAVVAPDHAVHATRTSTSAATSTCFRA